MRGVTLSEFVGKEDTEELDLLNPSRAPTACRVGLTVYQPSSLSLAPKQLRSSAGTHRMGIAAFCSFCFVDLQLITSTPLPLFLPTRARQQAGTHLQGGLSGTVPRLASWLS